MKIIPLSEGAYTVDKTKKFVPFKTGDNLQQKPVGSILVEVQPFCIVTKKDVVLIDTGLGFYGVNRSLIHELLSANGIDAAGVTKVLLSHLHKDHAGGITYENDVKEKTLSFPNAVYYVNKDELAFGLDKNNTSYVQEDFDMLQGSSKVILTEGDGNIDGYITYQVTGAHCPFHQVFWIEEDGQKVFFGGDVAPQLQQMKNRFVAKYDYDGQKCMQLRQQWWEQGQKEKWFFLFYHDIKTPVYEF